MTDRKTASTINDAELDALYARVETLGHVAAGNKRHVQLIVPDLERAEAAIARVRALHTRVLRMEALACAHCGCSWPCATVNALDKPADTKEN